MRNSFHYAAVHLGTIANSARDVDFAMRWGFGVKQGPFELWQEAGWKQVAEWVKEDIDAGKALSSAPLPDWVFDGRDGRAQRRRLVEPGAGQNLPLSALPVYRASISARTWAVPAASTRPPPARRCTRTTRCACGRWTTRW